MTPDDLNRQVALRKGWKRSKHPVKCAIHGHFAHVWKQGIVEICEDDFDWSQSHDAAHSLLDDLKDSASRQRFISALKLEMRIGGVTWRGQWLLLNATPAQICEAWLIATEARVK